jgi:type I restriction enzyme R subunit
VITVIPTVRIVSLSINAVDAPDEDAALELAEVEQTAEDAETPDGQDKLNALVAGRGRQDTISYYAFTATPKARTREPFGTLVEVDGQPRYVATHTYTMRQAIEGGFILDVLANYTTYKTFWKIEKAIRDDPEFDERKAKAAIARFVALHPTYLAQKAEVIVEHFRQHVAHRARVIRRRLGRAPMGERARRSVRGSMAPDRSGPRCRRASRSTRR